MDREATKRFKKPTCVVARHLIICLHDTLAYCIEVTAILFKEVYLGHFRNTYVLAGGLYKAKGCQPTEMKTQRKPNSLYES
ncbi:MAG: hypothetical protein Aurels2KO_56970 [Aureliella sp.]